VTRTPYLKETDRFVERARYFASAGYAYVIQNVRGRGNSEGNFYPFFNEAADGCDTLVWAASQEWCDGMIGTIGASYGAWTQWLCAAAGPAHLNAMIVEVSPPDFCHGLPYQNGALSLPMLLWLVQLDGKLDQDINSIDWNHVLSQRPLKDLDALCGRRIQAWQDWLVHDREDQYWLRVNFSRAFNSIRVPVFHISGWYDDVLNGTLLNYKGMLASAAKESNSLQKLLIGPWPHRINTTSKFGDIDFGETGIIDLYEVQRRWFDHWLKRRSFSIPPEPQVQFYVMGSNTWIDDNTWPPTRTVLTAFYLHSRGKANTLNGDGLLDRAIPGAEPADEYVYDPLNPVPFLKDSGWLQIGGPDDYSEVEKREDVLVYSSRPVEEDVQIAGPLVVKLFASTSATDTDFLAKILDAMPSGYVMRLNDGIVRARFRCSLANPTAIRPGVVYEYTIDCWATSYVFRKGHRIRVEISSSAFPKFDPNLNTGESIGEAIGGVRAVQTVFHSREYPSHVLLPVVK
jgi:uncharacterized protein